MKQLPNPNIRAHMPSTPDAAWAAFVQESSDKGRNNSMMSLFLRLYGCGMEIDDAIAYTTENYREEWPKDLDEDFENQLERAASRAWEGRESDYLGTADCKRGPSQKSIREKRKDEVAMLKEQFPLTQTLDEMKDCPADMRLTLNPRTVLMDDQCYDPASLLAGVLRAIAGDNAYVFLGHREDSYFSRPCWFNTDEDPGEAAMIPIIGDEFKNNLQKRIQDAVKRDDWPELICNCSFQKPERHLDENGKATGHRQAKYVNRITCFTVECDKSLTTGLEPTSEEEKNQAKAETLELFQWLHWKLNLKPVLIVDSGNKSLQATYLLSPSARPLEEQTEQMHRLGDLLGVLGADPAVLSVPRVFRAPAMRRVTRDENGVVINSVEQTCLHFDAAAPRYELDDVIVRLRGLLGPGAGFIEELEPGTELNLDILRRYLNEQPLRLRFNLMTHQLELQDWQRFKLCSHDITIEDLPVILHDCLKPHLKCSKDDFAPMLATIAHENYYHPVVDWLRRLPTDTGTDAIEELCACMGVEEGTLAHCLVEKWLKQCVAIAFNSLPGKTPVQPYGVLVLQGPQGIGKTTLLKKLAVKDDWFTSILNLDPDNKDSVIQATSRWVCEIGELDSTTKKEQANLKALLTNSSDTVRRPYDHVATGYPRTTSFAASVNPDKFLTDQSGNRRFWTIRVTDIDRERLNRLDITRLWAQVFHAWQEEPDFDLTRKELEDLETNVNQQALQQLPGEIELLDYLDANNGRHHCWMSATEVQELVFPFGRIFLPAIGKALKKILTGLGHGDYIKIVHNSNRYWMPIPRETYGKEYDFLTRPGPPPQSSLDTEG